MHDIYKVLIIGSGPAGLTAGIYAARSNLQPLIVQGKTPGGQLMTTTLVENWPGEKSIMGPQLMQNMQEHAKKTGCQFLDETIVNVDFSQSPFRIVTDSHRELKAHSVIIATGATPRKLNVPGESTYWGKGVTTCAVCDGALYKGLPVVIVGGGDTAMEEASFMAKLTNKITLIQINEKLTAQAIMQERVLNNPAFTILYNSAVTEIKGDGQKINSIVITDQKTQQKKTLPTSAVFVAIGTTPMTQLFKNQLSLDAYGYIVRTGMTHTSIPGVFCAGDVADSRYRQAIASAGDGCRAAMDAEQYLVQQKLI